MLEKVLTSRDPELKFGGASRQAMAGKRALAALALGVWPAHSAVNCSFVQSLCSGLLMSQQLP